MQLGKFRRQLNGFGAQCFAISGRAVEVGHMMPTAWVCLIAALRAVVVILVEDLASVRVHQVGNRSHRSITRSEMPLCEWYGRQLSRAVSLASA
jgi:hypothetical protein